MVQAATSGPLDDSEFKAVRAGSSSFSIPLFLSFTTRRARLQEMTAPKGKEKVFPAELKSLQHFHRANIAPYSRLNFLVEAKKGKFLLRRVWPTNSKVTRATAWSDYPSVFLILSCGTSGEKYEETINSLDNSQKEEFRVNFTRNVKWLGRLQGRLRARGGTVFLSSATRASRSPRFRLFSLEISKITPVLQTTFFQ